MFFRSIVIVLVSVLPSGCVYSDNMESSAKRSYSFALYALSRGKGVPAATRNAFNRIRGKLEQAEKKGNVMHIQQSRIGIEGESRLCVEFNDAHAENVMLSEIRESIKNIELLNLKSEPCPKAFN